MNKLRLVLLLSATSMFVPGVHGGITSSSKRCAEGDADACAMAELESRIDFSQFNPKDGKYAWVVGYSFPNNFGKTAKQRAENGAHAYCAEVNTPWLGEDVALYRRLTGFVAVERKGYDACMDKAMPNYLREERKRQLKDALGIAAIVAPFLLAVAALWYRRPLARVTRALLSRLNKLGPQ